MRRNVAKNGGAGGIRLDKLEVERRLDVVDKMVRDGLARAAIVEAMRSKFGASPRATDRYISKARARWAAESLEGREAQRTATLDRLHDLSAKAEKRGAFAAAVGAERLRVDVLGLREPQALEVQTTVHVPPPLPEPTLEEAYRELAGLVALVANFVRDGALKPTPELVTATEKLAAAIGFRLNPRPAANDCEDEHVTTTTGVAENESGAHEVVPAPLPHRGTRSALRVVDARRFDLS